MLQYLWNLIKVAHTHTLDKMRPKSRIELIWQFCMIKSMIWGLKNPYKFDYRAKLLVHECVIEMLVLLIV